MEWSRWISRLSIVWAHVKMSWWMVNRRVSDKPRRAARAILVVGIPASGKSTLLAQRFSTPEFAVLSTDAIRAELFGDAEIQGSWEDIEVVLRSRILQAFRRGQTAVIDATHARVAHRVRALSWLRAAGATSIEAMVLQVPLEKCLERNASRSRKVPPEVIRDMHGALQKTPPSREEGFDSIQIVDN